jgi:hypothetical protein
MNASLGGEKMPVCGPGILIPDFYDAVEISGGGFIPQTGTFHRIQ